ncbi:hypothetical protein Micbo1qcDRAFT_34842 [Microdochium bolleyi]|uniref:Zn(2)-C6 fungal-type domain-containing protein n=1 Tax=Microdochium bolleyi TaxID=196109 RepID=A0A136INS0_9PEZI|nr:hypothetical protein Micbo1qcDRAFT_34842 [Microdochium bolleyi]
MTGSMSGVARRPPPAPPRSCLPCHQRKVRCDKKAPCSACVRGSHRCVYPSPDSSTHSPRRRPRSSIADIAGRLQQLEGTIISLSSGEAVPTRSQTAPSTTSTAPTASYGMGAPPRGDTTHRDTVHVGSRPSHHRAHTDASSSHSPSTFTGVLRSGHESNEYVNEILLSRVLEEQEDENRPAEQQQDEPTPRTQAKTAMESPIGYPFSPAAAQMDGRPTSALDLLPPRGEATQLWRAFVQNTTGLLCLLHLPTTQIAVFTAIDNPGAAPPDTVCLLHAICFSAITSIWPAEAAALLNMPKAEALGRAKTGFELALSAANVMERPTVTALQAITLFTETLRAHRISRSDWAFLGLAIRLAQSLGVHRDGAAFFPRMSLFEAEMRRRLWWHLQAQDKRAGEDHGFVTDSSFVTGSSNSNGASNDQPRLPLHVDDSALHPGMTAYPPPATHFCTTTHFLIMAQSSLALQELSRMIVTGASEAERQKVVDGLMERVRPMLGYINPVIPEQKTVLVACQIVLAKRDFVSRVQLLSRHPSPLGDSGASSNGDNHNVDRGNGPDAAGTAAAAKAETTKVAIMEESLLVACDILDMDHVVYEDELLRSYRWLAECYPQYHLLLYVLWHLNVRPTQGPNVERAWAAVDRVFEHEATRAWRQGVIPLNAHVSAREYRPTGSVWAVFLRLRDKALRARAAAAAAAPAAGAMEEPTGKTRGNAFESEADRGTIHVTSEGVTSAGSQMGTADEAHRGARVENRDGVPDDPDQTEFYGGMETGDSAASWQHGVQDWDTLLADFASQDYSFWGAP